MMDKTTLKSVVPLETLNKLLVQEPEKTAVPNRLSSISVKADQKTKEQTDKKQSRRNFQEAKKLLELTFPKAFNFKNPIPLKINIHTDIRSLESPISCRQRMKVLRGYVYSAEYLKAVVQGQWRHDLNGQQIEEISQKQKLYAQEQIEERQPMWEQRKEERKKKKQYKKTNNKKCA